MPEYTLSAEMVAMLLILGFTLFLFISEVVRVDVAAVTAMVVLGSLSYVWPLFMGEGHRLLDLSLLFNGFASNAVVSIIAVIIIGAGLDKTGVMSRVAGFILKVGGNTEGRIIPLISGTVGVISSFMQNIGAAALFLPVVSRISVRTNLPMSRLLMPMGFCAILGGTITMIGSSPLIMLNDLIVNGNKGLPPGVEAMGTFSLFEVTPIGLALLAAGIVYFVLAGRWVLPSNKTGGGEAVNTLQYLRDVYGLTGEVYETAVTADSALVGRTVEEVEGLCEHRLLVVASHHGSDSIHLPPGRGTVIEADTVLAFSGSRADVEQFAQQQGLTLHPELKVFTEVLTPTRAGIAELVIPPNSQLNRVSLLDLRMRKTYGLNVLAVYRGETTIRQGFRDLVLQAGDTLVVHTLWDNLAALEKNRDFVVVTSDYPHEELRPHKVGYALGFFLLAVGLALFTDMKLSLALFIGAIGMVLSGVLSMDEAYKKVSWQSVFLLASLLPLGQAMTDTHTAAWIAQETVRLLSGTPVWVLQAALAVLATALTLATSNVAATALLVPIAINMAVLAQADPRLFALTVALATSNSFIIPTHQVNALIMGPAGYRVKDFLRAGSVMSVLFLVVMLGMLNLMY